MSLKRGIDKTVQGLIAELERKARPIKGQDDIKGITYVMYNTWVHQLHHTTNALLMMFCENNLILFSGNSYTDQLIPFLVKKTNIPFKSSLYLHGTTGA